MSCNNVNIKDQNCNNVVSIPQCVTKIVEVASIGPQGPQGPPGQSGSIGTVDTGSFAITGSNVFRGTQIISGSVNISGTLDVGNRYVKSKGIDGTGYDYAEVVWTSGSIDGIIGINSTYAHLQYLSASIANEFRLYPDKTQLDKGLTAPSFTGSLQGTSSWSNNAVNSITASYALTTAGTITNAVSSSYAATASYLLGNVTVNTSSLVQYTVFNSFTASYNTGSFTGSFTGSLQGTSSWATNAITASYVAGYVPNTQTSSFVLNSGTSSFITNSQTSSMSVSSSSYSTSGSYALTASYALNGGGSPVAISDEGSQLTAGVTSINFTGAGITATTAGNAVTVNVPGGGSGTTFPYTGSALISGSLTLTGSLYVSGSTTQIGSNTLIGNTTLSGSIIVSGSNPPGSTTASMQVYGDIQTTGYHRFDPVTPNIIQTVTASYIYVSGSTNDLYFSQNGNGYNNTTRLRWLEGGALYTGILRGGIISTTPGSTTFNITSGSGLIVTMNASTASEPYPTVQYIYWSDFNNVSLGSITTSKLTYVGINANSTVQQQVVPWGTNDINQWDNSISLGVVLHLSGSVTNGVFNAPQIAYGPQQKQDDFFRAFGPLKISGHTLQASGSLGLKKTAGTSYREGANYVTNANHPSTVVENSINTSKIYRYYISGSTPVIDTGISNAGYTTIDNQSYVVTATGQLSNVTNGQFSLQRVFWVPNSPTNAFIVYYGNAVYNSLLDAVAAKDTEPFTEAPNTAQNAILVAYVAIRGGTNANITSGSDATIIQAGLFRNVGGIGSGGTNYVSTTLAGLADVSLTGSAAGDLLVYGGSTWNNKKQLSGSYGLTGSLSINGALTTNDGLYTQAITSSFISASSGITGSLFGTSSWSSNSISASYIAGYVPNTQTSSFVLNSGTSSFVINSQTGSFATTGSNNFIGIQTITGSSVTSGSSHTRIGNIIITGSFNLTGSASIIGNVSASLGFTGSLFGTASSATSSSYALTASYALISATGGGSGAGFPYSGSAVITGSLLVSGSLSVIGSISSSLGITGSLQGTASFATSASYALSSSVSTVAITSNNGGVTSIIAGSNVTINTSTGAVTITSNPLLTKGQIISISTGMANLF